MAEVGREEYEEAAALRVALRRFLSRSEELTREHGLTPERYELLLLIKTAPDGEATIGRLAGRLSVGQSAATQLARRAEDLGLIERAISRSDARVRLLCLTVEGERRLADALASLRTERAILRRLLAMETALHAPAEA